LEKNWRKLELETDGPLQMAKKAVTYKYGDLWMDFPELDVENPDEYEIEQNHLSVNFIGRWKGMTSYLVELDENGYVLLCEAKETDSSIDRPDHTDPETVEGQLIPVPTPQPNGKPWFWGKDFADAEFWARFDEAMTEMGVSVENYPEKAREWENRYRGAEPYPEACFVIDFFMSQTDEASFQDGYPIFSREGKPGREELEEKARTAFHEAADSEMGEAWVDSLKIQGYLWSDSINYDTGERFGRPVWFFNIDAYEEATDSWNSTGDVIMDEDGRILLVSFDPNGNG
jgi:hypothetical protein